MTKADFNEALENARKAFVEMRDTMKLKAHLLRMELKDSAPKVEEALNEIEKGLGTARADLEREGSEARLQGALAAMEARDRWQALRAELHPTMQALKEGGHRLLDESRLEEALQKINSELSHKQRKSEAQKWMERAGKPEEQDAPLADLAKQMKSAANEFVDWLRQV